MYAKRKILENAARDGKAPKAASNYAKNKDDIPMEATHRL